MKKLILMVVLGAVGSALSAEIAFTGGTDGSGVELTAPENWTGGVCPGEEDVAIIPVGNEAKTLVMSADWKVKGLRFTSPSAVLTIAGADGLEELPKLQLGADGVTVATSKSKTNGLVLRVPVEILSTQEWELGQQILKTYARFYGSAELTIRNAYTVDHYAPPEYDGSLYYILPNLEWNQAVYLRACGKWANVVEERGGYCNIGVAPPAGEKWNWSDIFPASTRFGGSNVWSNSAAPLIGADSTSEMTFAEADTEGYRFTTTTATRIGPGVFNQTGGTFTMGNAGMMMGNVTYRLFDGTFKAASEGYLGVAGMDVAQDAVTQIFDQLGGTANFNGLMIGGIYGNWEVVKSGFGQYVLGGGTLNVKSSTGWNSFGGGLCLAAKRHTRGDQSGAPGVFTQTGGVANVDFVRFGVQDSDMNFSNRIGFGLLDLAGGRFNLGAQGFLLGSTWNRGAAAGESNACYRVRLTGGTFAPTGNVLMAQMDLPPSETPVDFEPQRDLIVQAPIWGEGTLRKTGPKKLVLEDVSRFTGTIDVEEGALDIAAGAADPDEATCIKWTGDSLAAAGYQDGTTVETWAEANNGGARKAVAYEADEGKYQPPCPTFEANAFGSHAGVKFAGSALTIPTADNPVAGQTNWSVVVVFKTTQIGGVNNDESHYVWCYTPGLLGNSSTGWQDDSWGVSTGNAPVTESLIFGVGYAGNDAYAPVESSRGNRADGKVHVVVCTQSTWDQVSTINLDGVMTSLKGNMKSIGAHPRRNVPCYLGFHSSDVKGKTDAAGFANGSFNGSFAEIRFYQDRVLTLNEQNALIRALAAKYGEGSATADESALPTPAVAFDADSVDGADGAAVTTWTATGGALAATQELGGGESAPTLVKGAFAGHNALRFDANAKSALGLAHDSIPWLNQKNLGVAIVFRTKTDGLDDQYDTYGNSIQGRGLLSTSGKQKKSVNGFSLSFRQRGTVAAFCKTTDLGDTNFRKQLIHTKKPCCLNDGAVHVAVATYDEAAGKLRLMVDGYYAETAYAATAVQDSPENLLIGSLNKDSSKYFTGEIAEVKLFGSALSRAEMRALTDNWAAKYKFQPLTGKLFTSLADVTGSGIAASRIRVAANATLAMPAATLGAGQELSVAGSLEGDLTLTDGATLKATVGTVGEIPSLTATGAVTLDVSGLPQDPPRWTPLLKVGSYNGDAAVWTVVGDNVDPSLSCSVRIRDGVLGVYVDKGSVLLIR